MARERLTSHARQAADDKTPYPGSVNQEGREEEQRGSMTYRTFEPSIANHELTDYTKVHGVSDQHNEIGFGVPDPASGMLVASTQYQAKCIKAAELAETFLGPKVSDHMLLAQARDFLSLDDEVLDRTIERFNRTDTLYVAGEDEDAEEDVEEENEEGEDESEEEEAAEAVAEPEAGEGEVEEEASEEEAAAQEVAIPAAPAAAMPNDETDNPSRQIPQMPEGQAAAPAGSGAGSMSPEAAASTPEAAVAPVVEVEATEAMYMSEARATNLAQLAACTLQAHECTQQNIVKQAKKFASMNNEQVKVLLASFGRVATDDADADDVDDKGACVAEDDAAAPIVDAPVEAPVVEEEASEVEVASMQGIDISSFDLNEEFNDGPVTATEQDQAELASIFDDQAPQMMPQTMDPTQTLTASIAALAGGRSKTASKIGVKSVGKVTLQNTQAQPSNVNELEGLWTSPDQFPGGGF